MLNGVTFSDIERNDYLTPDIFGNSSRSESPYDDDEIERLIHYLIKRKGFKKDLDLWLIPPIDVDFSSVKPHFKIDNKTYSTSSKVSEENIISAMLENDFIIKLPKNRQKVRLKIKKVKKSERENRIIDLTSESSMEQKKLEGYF